MIIFYDTETTGMYDFKASFDDPKQPNMVQLAARLDNDQRETVAELNIVVDPYGFVIEAGAIAAHGITQAFATEHGVEPEKAVNQFLDLLDKADIAVGHNEPFDRRVISTAIHRYGNGREISNSHTLKHFCTMRAATAICKLPAAYGRKGYKWPTLMESYQILIDTAGFDDAHDALADVNACRLLYYKLVDEYPQFLQQGSM